MTEIVVEILEIIDIRYHDDKGLPASLGPCFFLFQPFHHVAPVRQLRQRIDIGHPENFLLRLFPLGNVPYNKQIVGIFLMYK